MKLMINGKPKEVCAHCNTMTGDHHETCPNNPDYGNYIKRRNVEQKERWERKERAEHERQMNSAKYFVTMTDWRNLWETGKGWVHQGKTIHKLIIPCVSKRMANLSVRLAKKKRIYNNIRISRTRPHYNPRTHKVEIKDYQYLWSMPEE